MNLWLHYPLGKGGDRKLTSDESRWSVDEFLSVSPLSCSNLGTCEPGKIFSTSVHFDEISDHMIQRRGIFTIRIIRLICMKRRKLFLKVSLITVTMMSYLHFLREFELNALFRG